MVYKYWLDLPMSGHLIFDCIKVRPGCYEGHVFHCVILQGKKTVFVTQVADEYIYIYIYIVYI